jgi:hypothetical protein
MSIVVNYADGGYRRLQARLSVKCQEIHQECLLFESSHGFTSHHVIPYAFKVDALRRAFGVADTALWVDAPVYPSGLSGLEPIFNHIRKKGYLFKDSGFRNSEWCNDRSLAAFGFTRDEAESQKHAETGILGICVSHMAGRLVWEEFSSNTDLFRGSWSNVDGKESKDIRCKGHRHDQSIISLIAARHSLDVDDVISRGWFKFGVSPTHILNYGRS